MSTPSTPGISSAPASGWYPNLTSTSTTQQVGTSVLQLYQLVYSLRDTVSQLQRTVSFGLQYGTDSQRQQFNPQVAPNGGLWFDTDTGNIYQSRLASQQTTRTWNELTIAGGAAGPEGPEGPEGPQGPAGPVNPQNFLYNPPGLGIGATLQNNFGLPMFVKVLMSYSGGADAGIAAQIGPAPPPNQVVSTAFVPSTGLGGIQLETFFIVPINWFYVLSATPGASISFWSIWY